MAADSSTRTGRLSFNAAGRRVREAAARHVRIPSQCGVAPLLHSEPVAFVSSLRVVVDRCRQSGAAAVTRGIPRSQTTGVDHMRLVIIGAGFAGMNAALSAARLRDIQGVSPEELEIALVAPEPTLVVRPRLYEPRPETLTAPLLDLLTAIDVVYVQGSAEKIGRASCRERG